MIIIKRKMTAEKIHIDESVSERSQASINSDGNITLRNYNLNQKNDDEIIVFSKAETQAIITLMKVINEKFAANDLPF